VSAREPVSWLRLEQQHLGELPAAEELSDADAACLAHIEADRRALPPLRLPERRPSRIGWLWPSVGLATATVLAVLVWRGADEEPSLRTGVKGGELAMVLVRERDGAIEEEPTTFAPGDRFKLLVTCAAADPVHWDVVVTQGDARSYPLTPSGPLACGSRVALPGAFRLTGDAPVTVCLVVQGSPWERDRVLPDGPCLRLSPLL
jgi:hypothetical protein